MDGVYRMLGPIIVACYYDNLCKYRGHDTRPPAPSHTLHQLMHKSQAGHSQCYSNIFHFGVFHNSKACSPKESVSHETKACFPLESVFHETKACSPMESVFHETKACSPMESVFHETKACSPMESVFHETKACSPVYSTKQKLALQMESKLFFVEYTVVLWARI